MIDLLETQRRGGSMFRFGRGASGPEARLVAGKVQNLRVAVGRVGWRRFEANETFSFWRHVGRPSRRAAGASAGRSPIFAPPPGRRRPRGGRGPRGIRGRRPRGRRSAAARLANRRTHRRDVPTTGKRPVALRNPASRHRESIRRCRRIRACRPTGADASRVVVGGGRARARGGRSRSWPQYAVFVVSVKAGPATRRWRPVRVPLGCSGPPYRRS